MNIAIDFSFGKTFSISLFKEKVYHTLYIKSEKYLSRFIPLFTYTIFEIGDMKEIEKIVVSIGPGSFTSLRAVLSYIKGLAFPLNIPIEGYYSFDIAFLATGYKKMKMYSGSKNLYYFAKYEKREEISREIGVDEGNNLKEFESIDGIIDEIIGSKYLAEISIKKIIIPHIFTKNLEEVSPIYLFDAVTKTIK